MEVNLNYYLILSGILFSTGVLGVLIRRSAIIIFMCVELMLNAVNLSLVAFSAFLGNLSGQVFVFFVMTVAAAEVAVGIGIIIAVFRNRETINVDEINILKW
ncbi:MAG: NADH-quinone oxidoreductase subunit NuoK [Ignavibacteria bacterium]